MARPCATYPENWNYVYNDWKSGKIKAVEAMKILDLKRCTFYKLVNMIEKK